MSGGREDHTNGVSNGENVENTQSDNSLINGVPIISTDSLCPSTLNKTIALKRCVSYGKSFPAEGTETRVLVIYTGGTIGMMRNENDVLQPIPNALVKRIRKYPDMHDEAYAEKRFGIVGNLGPLILPRVQNEPRRVIYTITEYEPLLDSSNMTTQDWVRIADDIRESYQFYDGFVILHGTDTLSYTASALSFMLENLGKTVIITGSQIPIFETRTDGKDNLTSALILAGNYVIPEVCVVFGTKLLRGNRTIKISSEQLEAFDTPNVTPLAKIGINVEIDYRSIFRPCTVEKFSVQSKLDENVGILRIFPSVSLATFRAFLQSPMKGVVLQTFGAGNVPSNREDLMEELKAAVNRDVIIINCTQCSTGSVSAIYETGSILSEIGVIPGFDMTPEAALTKLAYVLGKTEWSLDVKKQMMQTNLRGELTSDKAPKMEAYDLIDAVARTLHLSTPKELEQLGAILFPAIVNSAVLVGDIKKIDNLKSYGADLAGVNYDRRTALHIACCEGNKDIVKYLLLNGVSVHLRDRHDRTPLMEAIAGDYHDIIRLLINCGAHLTGSSRALGEQICAGAARGYVKRLQSYRIAGADLSQPDPSGRTPLHIAALHGHRNIVEYLLKNHVEKEHQDMLGFTALDYAKKTNHPEIVQILQ